eukprot:CFRG7602T1
MGILCCKPRREDAEENRPLLKNVGSQGGIQSMNGDVRRESINVHSVFDENSVLQVILERTANELIDINRVTLGSQLCKRDYMERENQYRLILSQQVGEVKIMAGGNNFPEVASRNVDTNAIMDLLNAPSPYSAIADEVDADTEAVVEKVTSFELKDVGQFVVELDPIS